jgi:hypothetical protein
MSAAALIYYKLSTDLGYVAMPDLRNASQALSTNLLIYEVKSEDMETALPANIKIWKSSIDVYILASTLKATADILQALTTDLNGATWTSGGETAFMCRVTGASHGYLEESSPGSADRTRYSMINLLMFHQN